MIAGKGFPLYHRTQASSTPFAGSPPPRGTHSPGLYPGTWPAAVLPAPMPPLAACPTLLPGGGAASTPAPSKLRQLYILKVSLSHY